MLILKKKHSVAFSLALILYQQHSKSYNINKIKWLQPENT